MGDDGRLYVPEDAAAVYGEAVVPLASVLTPNQFEAERLTGRAIASEADALAACRLLHARGPATVVRPKPEGFATGSKALGGRSGRGLARWLPAITCMSEDPPLWCALAFRARYRVLTRSKTPRQMRWSCAAHIMRELPPQRRDGKLHA